VRALRSVVTVPRRLAVEGALSEEGWRILRTHRAKGRLTVIALAATTMVLAPLALLHSGAAPAAATDTVADGGRAPTSSASLGATQLVASDVPVAPATPAQLARHRAAVRHNEALWDAQQARHAVLVRHASAVRHNDQLIQAAMASRSALVRHRAAVLHNDALWRAAHARHLAALRRAARGSRPIAVTQQGRSATGIATWYAWHPGQCASPFLPHGTLLTVTDLATHKTIQCLVTDTEAHNPGRVVDLSQYCFEELGSLSQGVILVRITW